MCYFIELSQMIESQYMWNLFFLNSLHYIEFIFYFYMFAGLLLDRKEGKKIPYFSVFFFG